MKLKDYLKKNRWTVASFAKAIGVSRVMIYNYFDGTNTPSPEIKKKMAKALEITKTELEKLI